MFNDLLACKTRSSGNMALRSAVTVARRFPVDAKSDGVMSSSHKPPWAAATKTLIHSANRPHIRPEGLLLSLRRS